MPLKQILLLMLLISNRCITKQHKTIVVFDYAGSMTNPGRVIDGQYERTLTHKGIQIIHRTLEENKTHIVPLFCRLPGQDVTQQEKAHFSNQIKADLYIALQMYQANTITSHIHLYYYDNQTCSPYPHTVRWVPFDQAHLLNAQKTKDLGMRMQQTLSTREQARHYELYKPIGLPCHLLKGITAPALCIEVGIHDQHQMITCMEAVAQALEELCLYLHDM